MEIFRGMIRLMKKTGETTNTKRLTKDILPNNNKRLKHNEEKTRVYSVMLLGIDTQEKIDDCSKYKNKM